MNILAIDTSTKNYSLALAAQDKLLASQHVHLNNVLVDSMIPGLEKILFLSKLTLADIGCLVVGLGPGSFTSLRVGISSVKALGWSLNIPIVGVSSLDAIAANVGEKLTSSVAVIVDARRQMVFSNVYQIEQGQPKAKRNYLLGSPAELLKTITTDTLWVGDGIKLYRDMIEQAAAANGWRATFAEEHLWAPQAEKLLVVARNAIEHKVWTPPEKLTPLYLYPEDCQVSNA